MKRGGAPSWPSLSECSSPSSPRWCFLVFPLSLLPSAGAPGRGGVVEEATGGFDFFFFSERRLVEEAEAEMEGAVTGAGAGGREEAEGLGAEGAARWAPEALSLA